MKSLYMFFVMASVCLSLPIVSAADQEWEITGAKFNYQVQDGQPYVFSIGYIENKSKDPLKDITVAVEYYNNNGELIDADYKNLYSLTVPSNDKVAFKIETYAARAKENYAKQVVRIVSAERDAPCSKTKSSNSKSTYSQLKKTLINWFPLLLLIIVWVVIAKKYSGKGSNQHKMVELMEQSVKNDEVRNREISSIADSLKSKQNDND